MGWRGAVVVLGGALLVAGSVLAFLGFDRHSHSVSDTIRPFVITMVPVWLLAFAAYRLIMAKRPKDRRDR